MGVGKSTVGALLASRLGRPFVDLDAHIQGVEGVDIPTLFQEGRFRAVEARALRQVLAEPPLVLATGGGAPCQPGAMDLLRASGWTCWLQAPFEVLEQRVGAASGRPLWDAEVRQRFERRQPIYAQAHACIGATGEDVAERVEEAWRAR